MTLSAGFIGLGYMGTPMAENLMKNGVKLFVYNRTKDKAADLIKKGAEWVGVPRDLFQKTSIVFSMVANDEALLAITLGPGGLLEQGKPGLIHVSMSTVSPDLIRELTTEHQKKGIALLSAPVFGRPEMAQEKKLNICLAGSTEAKKKVSPLLKFMGQKIYDFGESPEKANLIKIAGNFLILSNIEIVSEAFAFIQKNGGNIEDFNTVISEVLFPSVMGGYGFRIVSRSFEPVGLKMELGLKDIGLLLKSATDAKIPMPIAHLLQCRLLTGLAKNRAHLDWSAISLSSFEDAGMEVKD